MENPGASILNVASIDRSTLKNLSRDEAQPLRA
jgi:hypothetical protein